MSGDALLAAEHVTVDFGGNRALSDVERRPCRAGEITGLIGPNGAGKTTLFNVITGMQAPTTGRIVFDGRDVSRLETHKRARLGIARTFQRLELFVDLSVRDNLRVAAEIRNTWSPFGRLMHRARDRDARPNGCSTSSGSPRSPTPKCRRSRPGTARVVELARALMIQPRVLLLDEPASGQTDDETKAFEHLIRRLARDDGLTVLLIEHDMGLVMDVCDRIHVLDFGEIIAVGTPDEVRNDPRVIEAYLGTTANDSTSRPVATDLALELRDVHAAYGTIDVLRGVESVGPVRQRGRAPRAERRRQVDHAARDRRAARDHARRRHRGGAPRQRRGARRARARAASASSPRAAGIFANLSVRENLWMVTQTGASRRVGGRRRLRPLPHPRAAPQAARGDLVGRRTADARDGPRAHDRSRARCCSTSSRWASRRSSSSSSTRSWARSRSEGVSLLVVEQFARAVLGIADWAGIMLRGRVAMFDRPSAVEAELSSAYLG